MDRLSADGRAALDAYRDSLALGGKRAARNWSAIEARAADGVEDITDASAATDAPVPAPSRRGNTITLVAAGVAVLAAAVALLAVGPLALGHAEDVSRSEAAPYAVADEEPSSVAVTPADARTTAAPHRGASPTPPPAASAEVPMVTPVVPERAPTKPGAAKPRRLAPAPTENIAVDAAKQLLAETALLRRARAALRDGDHAAAIAATDEHRRRFTDGALAEDVAFVRISALCGGGRVDEGRAAARSFAGRWPGSPLARRVAGACPDG